MTGGSCPSENGILALTCGRETPERSAEILAHLGACDACRLIVGEAARARSSNPAEYPELGTFSAGARLGGRYEINRRIGAGGMGEVYEATDLLLGERVACKTLICSALDDDRAAQRLRAEVQLARRVSHPNVCRILEFGICETVGSNRRPENVPFFTMELLAGQTLSARLTARGPLGIEEARPLVLQMLDGLSAIHGQGIVHRDFKSDNIFLVEDDRGPRVVITDFGLACAVDLSRSLGASGGRIMGTVDYMAPEQLVGAQPTASFDIYALGIVLFELLTGTRPFATDDAAIGACRRFDREAPLLSTFLPQANRSWERVIARCLARAPGERFVTVEAVRAALFSPSSARGRPSRARLVQGSVSAIGVGLAIWLLARGGAPAVPPHEAARSEPRVVDTGLPGPPPMRNDPHPEPEAGPAPALPSSAPPRPARRRRSAAPSAPRASAPVATTDQTPAEVTPPARRDPIYSPRFETRPLNPSLGANGLPTPFSSDR
jgi:serine/threonine protein kinase